MQKKTYKREFRRETSIPSLGVLGSVNADGCEKNKSRRQWLKATLEARNQNRHLRQVSSSKLSREARERPKPRRILLEKYSCLD